MVDFLGDYDIDTMGHIKSNIPKTSFGHKIQPAARTGVALASGFKTAYDIGKTVYSVAQTVAPVVKAGLSML